MLCRILICLGAKQAWFPRELQLVAAQPNRTATNHVNVGFSIKKNVEKSSAMLVRFQQHQDQGFSNVKKEKQRNRTAKSKTRSG